MTDRLFPFLADGLVDGGLAADVAPADLRAAVDLLRAAGQPGSRAELAKTSARVQQFCEEVKASATTSTGQIYEFSKTSADDSLRSNPMFSTRITRKAMSIFAITLLAAGTAAAAAGGALPMFEEEEATEIVVDLCFNLETAVERRVECDPLGAGRGATSEE